MLVLITIAAGLIGSGIISLLEALKSFQGGWEYLRLFRGFEGRAPAKFAPPVTLVLPCKGVDQGLKENLSAYFEQDYPDWQILLVTGDSSDPAVAVLEEVSAAYPDVAWQILYSGTTHQRSQKVHNLLHALGFLRDGDEVLAFGDSDIRPARDWLRHLVSPLEDSSVGISTGYRWYLPQKGNFASVLRSVWNAGIASMMNEKDCYFAWGGAMAIRREAFRECRVADSWQSALSDDYAISHAVHSRALSIRFQPPCLSFSHEDCNFRQLLDWSARQLSITRVYHPGLWRAALVFQILNSLVLWGGIVILLLALGYGDLRLRGIYLALAALMGSIYLLGCIKGWMRLRAVLTLFPQHARELQRYRWAYVLWGPLASWVTLVGLARSLFSREIEWRGVRYRMVSPEETIVLDGTTDG